MKVTINKKGFSINYTKDELENLKEGEICKNFETAFSYLNNNTDKIAKIQIKQIESNSDFYSKELDARTHYADSVIQHDLECRKLCANLNTIEFQPDD